MLLPEVCRPQVLGDDMVIADHFNALAMVLQKYAQVYIFHMQIGLKLTVICEEVIYFYDP